MKATKHEFAEFAYGTVHLDPVKAVDPGLVYEATKDDYTKLVCSLQYDQANITQIFGGNISCPERVIMKVKDLNYPAMAFKVDRTRSSFKVKFRRTVQMLAMQILHTGQLS